MLNLTNKALVSPINKNSRSKGNRDYQEQCVRGRDGNQLMWDDAKGNPTNEPGGVFGFIHNFDRVEIHMITKICTTDDRLPSWSDNVGQTDRKVLMLSPLVCVINWVDWIELGGAKKVQGTTRVVGAHDRLSQLLRERVGIIEYVGETGEIIFNNNSTK